MEKMTLQEQKLQEQMKEILELKELKDDQCFNKEDMDKLTHELNQKNKLNQQLIKNIEIEKERKLEEIKQLNEVITSIIEEKEMMLD